MSDDIAAHRERMTQLVTELVAGMADAVDLLGDMDREVETTDGRKYKVTIKRA